MTNALEGSSPENKKHSKRFDAPVIPPSPPKRTGGRGRGDGDGNGEQGEIDCRQVISPDGRAFVQMYVQFADRKEDLATLPAGLAVMFANKLMHHAYEAEGLADLMKYLTSKGMPLQEVMTEVNSFGNFKQMWLAQQAAMAQAAQRPQPEESSESEAPA